MSLVHLRTRKILDDDNSIVYSIQSSDFNESMDWEEIGRLKIIKETKEYDFTLAGPCKNMNFVPLSFYDLSKKQQGILLEEEYRDCCCGAWSMRIHHWVNTFITENNYPENYPNPE